MWNRQRMRNTLYHEFWCKKWSAAGTRRIKRVIQTEEHGDDVILLLSFILSMYIVHQQHILCMYSNIHIVSVYCCFPSLLYLPASFLYTLLDKILRQGDCTLHYISTTFIIIDIMCIESYCSKMWSLHSQFVIVRV